MKHFISIAETPRDEIEHVLETAFWLRKQRQQGQPNAPMLAGQTLAMIFEKPSLRTKVSFQQAMYELGGNAINLSQAEIGLGQRESIEDVARVLSGMVQGICARVFEHEKLTRLAAASSVPVINALSDYSHPAQALADAMTIMDEFGSNVSDRTVAYVGDGNNVALSLAAMCGKLGMGFILSSPAGYELSRDDVDRIMSQAPSMSFELTHDPVAAVRHADVIYTDTWTSMGQEDEKQRRIAAFKDFQVNDELIAAAPDQAIVMHCLPAYRGLEITGEVMEGERSRVFEQAHNRLHAQKGLLAVLMGKD